MDIKVQKKLDQCQSNGMFQVFFESEERLTSPPWGSVQEGFS